MTTPNDALRELALKALAQQAGPAPDSAAIAAAAGRAYDDLAQVAAPLIGTVGIEAITSRALKVSQRQYPWLARAGAPGEVEGPFIQAIAGLEQQDTAVAAETAAAVFAALAGLLVTFIGEPLTMGLLRKAWPAAFAVAGNQKTEGI